MNMERHVGQNVIPTIFIMPIISTMAILEIESICWKPAKYIESLDANTHYYIIFKNLGYSGIYVVSVVLMLE